MARFFIDRPIFAWVIAIVVMLAGALSISRLSLEQYPNIAPPKITISANYTGASAETIENSVVQVIEQQMKGLDHLSSMSSSSSSAGSAQITLTFEAGTNPDVAQVQVQNKLKQAEPRLPQLVQIPGAVDAVVVVSPRLRCQQAFLFVVADVGGTHTAVLRSFTDSVTIGGTGAFCRHGLTLK